MKRDTPEAVRTIVEFIGANLQPDTIIKIVEQSSFDRMRHSTSLCTSVHTRYNLDEINPFVR